MPIIDPLKIKRILVTRTDRMGDVVLSTPVFSAVKKRYPSCYLAVLVLKETEPIVSGNPWVDRIVVYDKNGKDHSWRRTVKFGFDLRREKFDVVIHLHPTNRVNIISWLAGISVRIGYRRKNHHLLTHTIQELKQEGKKHEAEYNFDLLALIDIPMPDPLELFFSAQHQRPRCFGARFAEAF